MTDPTMPDRVDPREPPQETTDGIDWEGIGHDLAVERLFRTAYEALVALYSDERVEEYTAGGIEDTANELAATFGYMVDGDGQLYPTPRCSGDDDDDRPYVLGYGSSALAGSEASPMNEPIAGQTKEGDGGE